MYECCTGNHFLRPPDKSMCFGNRSLQCFNRWGRRSAPVKNTWMWPTWRWTWRWTWWSAKWQTWRWTWWPTWGWTRWPDFSIIFWVFLSDFFNISVKCYEFFSEMFCIFWWHFLDFSVKFFGFFGEIFCISLRHFLDFLMTFFGFFVNFFYFLVIFFGFLGEIFWSHMAWAPEGRERRSLAGPKGQKSGWRPPARNWLIDF